MSKNVKNTNKKRVIETKTRADGTTEYMITTAPQKTIVGKIVIITLCVLMGGGALLSLILALANI